MSIFFSDAVRNAMIVALETTGGTSAKFQVYAGAIPVDEAATPAGAKLVEATLPSDWQAAPSGGVAAKSGTWQGTAIAAGTATFVRLATSGGVVFFQASLTGDGLTIDNAVIAVGQVVTVTSFNITAPG